MPTPYQAIRCCFGAINVKCQTCKSRLYPLPYPLRVIQNFAKVKVYCIMVKTEEIKVKTAGNCDIVNITEQVSEVVRQSGIREGLVTVFNVGSTGGITTTEYEPGLVNYDITSAFEKIAPRNGRYEHEKTWHDDNGHSHVRASVLGPSLSVPVVEGQMTLGTWQQIILVDFDTRPRTRTVICQILGGDKK